MTNKEQFLQDVQECINCGAFGFSEAALKGFEELKNKQAAAAKEGLTENGKAILKFMQGNYEELNNNFKSKTIAEGLFTTGRSVSGSMRRLLADNLVEKISNSPVVYALTEQGKEYNIDK